VLPVYLDCPFLIAHSVVALNNFSAKMAKAPQDLVQMAAIPKFPGCPVR
jgi:hypothetical protein